jgi:hypothetical protein
MYCEGLGLRVLGEFEDHDGFDGVMVGREGSDHHLEFTRCRAHPVAPAPTTEDLLVFYLPDSSEWNAAHHRMLAAGFEPVASHNPYWERQGRTYEDPDGYRIVLQRAQWRHAED